MLYDDGLGLLDIIFWFTLILILFGVCFAASDYTTKPVPKRVECYTSGKECFAFEV
jgi:hypothetical protein